VGDVCTVHECVQPERADKARRSAHPSGDLELQRGSVRTCSEIYEAIGFWLIRVATAISFVGSLGVIVDRYLNLIAAWRPTSGPMVTTTAKEPSG